MPKINNIVLVHGGFVDGAGWRLGIVGFGALGKAVARRSEGLGMRVLATDFVLALLSFCANATRKR